MASPWWPTACATIAAMRDNRSVPPAVGAHSVLVRVESVDAHCSTARQHGATIVRGPSTYPYGERQYTARDPGGHLWTFSESVDDVDPAAGGGVLHE